MVILFKLSVLLNTYQSLKMYVDLHQDAETVQKTHTILIKVHKYQTVAGGQNRLDADRIAPTFKNPNYYHILLIIQFEH